MSELALPYGESFSYNLSGYRDIYSHLVPEDINGVNRANITSILRIQRKVDLLNQIYPRKGQLIDFECKNTYKVETNTKNYDQKYLLSLQPRIEGIDDPGMSSLETLSLYKGGYVSVSGIGEAQGLGLYEGFKPLPLSKFGKICVSLSDIINDEGSTVSDKLTQHYLIPIESDHSIAVAA